MNDFIKSGEFIANLRKEKGMTQQELGNLIGVGDKTVSKWERGINVPDVIMIKKIASVFDIEIDEILNGEKTARIDPKFIKMYGNKKFRYALFSVIGVLFILFFGLLIYFCNNFDKFKVYRFKSDNANYELTGNIYQVSNKYKMVVDDFVVYDTSKYEKLKIDTYKLSIFINDVAVYTFTEGKTIDDDKRNIEYMTYSEIIEKIDKSDLVIQQFDDKRASAGYIELLLVAGKESFTEKFGFKNMLQERNNAFFYDNKNQNNQTLSKR